MNRIFDAVTQFRRLLRIYPYSRLREQAQYNIAYVYLNTGNYDQAIEEFTTVIQRYPGTEWAARSQYNIGEDRKSTRLNSSHVAISYAVFCLKKKKTQAY